LQQEEENKNKKREALAGNE